MRTITSKQTKIMVLM